ncbi:hypothetical protein N7510_010801 [Penicillium lagena]|uniref:uncharacterized protein n=1 Tax=Penicillium lagena TaxID=94218 RepID=UPI002541E780|nr:uncharacterized protein N7510_010801 [Penicillium lagena]KAJ5601267.1 hypothetical protein N7510_010801 [Penicillium lagena]
MYACFTVYIVSAAAKTGHLESPPTSGDIVAHHSVHGCRYLALSIDERYDVWRGSRNNSSRPTVGSATSAPSAIPVRRQSVSGSADTTATK